MGNYWQELKELDKKYQWDHRKGVEFKFKQKGRDNYEGEGKAKGVTVSWSKGANHVINISGKADKKLVDKVIAHFAGQRIIKVNGKVVDKGRKNISKDGDYTTYRPGWQKDWAV
jgi:hypothetical protein